MKATVANVAGYASGFFQGIHAWNEGSHDFFDRLIVVACAFAAVLLLLLRG